ncbi:MAG: nucleotidyltransferase domain-containing protein [Thermoleophilia bacterium]
MKPKADIQIFSTNYQKVLEFLATHPEREYTEREVQESTGISKAGANNSLRSLVSDGVVEIGKKGRLSLYHVDLNNPLIRQTKVMINILKMRELIVTLKSLCDKIVLFGSAASGTDSEDSDIDLFVMSNNPEAVRKAVQKNIAGHRLHLVVRKPLDYMASKKKDRIFYDEVSRGIVLYEKKS